MYSIICLKENILILTLLIVWGILLIFYLYVRKMELTVTDRRVYGKTVFGRQVDLPIDSISAVGLGIFRQIAVASSSGKIRFLFVDNRNEIHKVITGLLIERQQQKAGSSAKQSTPTPQTGNADELKKYKELFDSGVITQEEFDAKKKQLLGL